MPPTVLIFLLTVTALQLPVSSVFLFLPAQSYGTGGYNPLSVAVADVNGDGKLDMVVANQCGGPDFCVGGGAISVLLGNGDGTFQTPSIYASGGSFLNAVVVADVNGDARPDLIAANGCGSLGVVSCDSEGAVGVLIGNGDGTFQAALTQPSGGFDMFDSDVAVADVNGDGGPDIIVMHGCATLCSPNSPPQGSVSVLLRTGSGAFGPAVSYASGGYFANSLAVADLDGNGNPDVVVVNWCDDAHTGDCTTQAPVAVLLGNGDGTFGPAVTYDSGGRGGRAVAVADLNADGKPDVLTGNCGPNGCGAFQPGGGVVGVLLGNGDGTFQSASAYGAGSYVSIAVADVDADNSPDVLAASMSCAAVAGTGCVDVLVGNGDGSLAAAVSYGAGIVPLSIAAADVNGDGAPDALVTRGFGNGRDIPPGMVDVLLNRAALLDITPPVITSSTMPEMLWPPNGTMHVVTVSGTITDTGSGVDPTSAVYSVRDEYGDVQPTGSITLDAEGRYTFMVLLQASRRGSDHDGRHYTVTVSVQDVVGNRASSDSIVTVPFHPARGGASRAALHARR